MTADSVWGADGSGLRYVKLPEHLPPQLLVTIDTEAEFDWNGPFLRTNRSVASIACQALSHEAFDRFGVVPIYLVDHAVASNDQAVGLLNELLDAGRCHIGAHLNPWLNPPYFDEDTAGSSFAGHLPQGQEHDKLACLTDLIEQRFGQRPRVYRAGRYGIGSNTPEILKQLGYQIDLSVLPRNSFRHYGGPSFEDLSFHPFWLDDERSLLEIPTTAGFSGRLLGLGPALYPRLIGPLGMALHLPGFFARTTLLERATLTPEGVTFDELKRLTKSLVAQGCRVFCLTYHSPSLAPGNTPYVRTECDLEAFLRRVEKFLDFFTSTLGGVPTTPTDVFAAISDQ